MYTVLLQTAVFFTYSNTKMQIFHRKLLIAFPENLHFSLTCKILQAAASFHLAVLHEICYLTSFFSVALRTHIRHVGRI